jgi:hypothetical protein
MQTIFTVFVPHKMCNPKKTCMFLNASISQFGCYEGVLTWSNFFWFLEKEKVSMGNEIAVFSACSMASIGLLSEKVPQT